MTLERFLDAQAPVYEQALTELRAGDKRSHWMWFVFPQLAGLGRSPTAQRFGLQGREEALAYLEHPVLGARLLECCDALAHLDTHDPVPVLGLVDALKLRSSMTLFQAVAPDVSLFGEVLDRYYRGEPDPMTLQLLS